MKRLKRFQCILAGLIGVALMFGRAEAQQQANASLLQRHEELREQLANNQFQRPLVLASNDQCGQLKGEVYAQLGQPLADAYPFDFLYQVKANQPDFLQVQLTAADGHQQLRHRTANCGIG